MENPRIVELAFELVEPKQIGLLVGLIGNRLTLVGVILVFAVAALTALPSPLRQTPGLTTPTDV